MTIGLIIITLLLLIIILIVKPLLGQKSRNKSEDYTEEIMPENFIYGNWLSENNSYYTFSKNGTYRWYKDKEVINDNYYEGNMTFVNGEEAMDELGITNEDFINSLSHYTSDKNGIYCIKLYSNKLVSGGIDKSDTLNKNAYSLIYALILPNRNGIFTNITTDVVSNVVKINE